MEGGKKGQSPSTSSVCTLLPFKDEGPRSVTSPLPLQTEPSAIERGSQWFPDVQKCLVGLLKPTCRAKQRCCGMDKFHLSEACAATLRVFGGPVPSPPRQSFSPVKIPRGQRSGLIEQLAYFLQETVFPLRPFLCHYSCLTPASAGHGYTTATHNATEPLYPASPSNVGFY